MAELYIICVEDEHQVLDALVKDLAPFDDVFPIEMATSADEARELIQMIKNEGNTIALALCDHIMPGEKGIDLMIAMQKDPFTTHTRKLLITGQAGLEDTIEAVNKAKLNRYIAKPWKPDQLLDVVKEELTQYVISREKDLLPYMSVLDQTALQEAIRNKGYI